MKPNCIDEKFTFFRFPSAFLLNEKYKKISAQGKILYTLMISRKNLSEMNNWINKDGRVYIYYTVDEISEDIGCGRTKAIATIKELAAFGLIETRRQGLGKPAMIFVNDIIVENVDNFTGKADADKPEITDTDLCESFNHTFVSTENESEEVCKQDSNYIYYNNINNNYINGIISDPVGSGESENKKTASHVDSDEYFDVTDWIEKRDRVKETVKDNIDYEASSDTFGKKWVDEIVELMVEVICSREKFIRINRVNYPQSVVAERFLNINSDHIEYIFFTTGQVRTPVSNIRSYMITTLYHSTETSASYMKAKVRHDLNAESGFRKISAL